MYKRNICLRLLLIAAIVVVQCLGSQPAPTQSVSKDDLRTNFKDLVAANPNHFGNAPDSNRIPVFPLAYDTTYEQLTCIGFNPVLSVLEATIEIKLPYGFGGDLCTNGSLEYVRFYVNYGNAWDDLGAVTVNTHDIPDAFDCGKTFEKPLFYVLTLPFQPIQQDCKVPLLPEIRAILSWSEMPPPSSPFWAPIFGNTVEQHIQSPALPLPPPTLDSPLCFPLEDEVLNKRSDSQELLEYHQNPADEQHIISEETSSTLRVSGRPGVPRNIWYEELIGLGLDYDLSRLVATIRIKRPFGYGSGLCQNGSFEYIAFWADWNNTCNWTYLGELAINVHNISHIPRDGLTYSAVLPVDLRPVSISCNTTKISRVRAALSWNSPPPTPPKVPARGNWLQTHVQIQPYTTPPNLTHPVIFSIGSVTPQNIDVKGNGLTLPGATFAGYLDSNGNAVLTDPWWPQQQRQCPFGGGINIIGPAIGQPSNADVQPSQYQYRLVYRPAGSTSDGLPVLNPITVTDTTKLFPYISVWQPLNLLGYFYYQSPPRNVQGLLSRWTPPDRGLYQIRLEIATQTSPTPTYDTVGVTDWYNVQVNNQANPAGPAGEILFTNEPICGTFPVGSLLNGTFWAVSPFFYQYALGIVNSGIPNPVVIAGGLPDTGPTEIFAPGIAWSLDTHNSTPCGYVIQLTVWDLTIYDSNPGERYSISVDKGFCVSPAKGP
jgi:hypothetical protein